MCFLNSLFSFLIGKDDAVKALGGVAASWPNLVPLGKSIGINV